MKSLHLTTWNVAILLCSLLLLFNERRLRLYRSVSTMKDAKSFCSCTFSKFPKIFKHCFSHWRLTRCQTEIHKDIIYSFHAVQNRDKLLLRWMWVLVMRCTHHSPQVMLLHQPEGVLVAGGEVVGLSAANMTSGHWAHSVDHICQKGTTYEVHVSTATKQGWTVGSFCSCTIQTGTMRQNLWSATQLSNHLLQNRQKSLSNTTFDKARPHKETMGATWTTHCLKWMHLFSKWNGSLDRKSITKVFYAIYSYIQMPPCTLFPFA